MVAFKDRTGERFKTNEGYSIIIIEYNNANDVLVQFQDKYEAIIHTNYKACKNGSVKNPYHPNKYGGYIGVGEYGSRENGELTRCHQDWRNMLERLYEALYRYEVEEDD